MLNDVLDELDEAAAKLSAENFSVLDDASLTAATAQLARFGEQIKGLTGRMAAELDARGTTDREWGVSTGRWLADRMKSDPGRAHRDVDAATKLHRVLPEVAAAVENGRLSWDQAKVIADAANPRIEDGIAALQETFIADATTSSFRRWKNDVRFAARLLDHEAGYDPSSDVGRNELSLVEDVEGFGHLRATLGGETMAITKHVLHNEADRLFRRYQRDAKVTGEPIPARATLLALALAEICRQSQAVDASSSKPPSTDVTLVVHASDPVPAGTPGAVQVQDDTFRKLLCDARFTPVVVDNLGVPLDLGRSRRLPTRGQRKAVLVRDGGCTFPEGCDAPLEWVQIHHVDEWDRDGGDTDVHRMSANCWHHHGFAHRDNVTVEMTGDEWTYWINPHGHFMWGRRHGRQREGPPTPEIFAKHAGQIISWQSQPTLGRPR